MGRVEWSRVPPIGVSLFEHKMTFKDNIAMAEANLLANAGRGSVTAMIAVRSACSLLSTLPGFAKVADGSTFGPHIYGTLDGVTVVRVPHEQILNPNEIICLYKGQSPFEAPAVYAPYMPLVVTSTLPTGYNPLLSQRAAAVWSAVDILVPSFITKIVITDTPQQPVVTTKAA